MALGRHVLRLVLKDSVSMRQVDDLARVGGWELVGEVERNPEGNVPYEVIWDAGDGTSVYYVADDLVDERYIAVQGADRDVAQQLAAHIASALDVWNLQDFIRDFDRSTFPILRGQAVLRLGVGAPLRATPEILERLSRCAEDRHDQVRRAALWAMIFAEWPEFMPVIARLAESDPNPELASEARRALQAFQDAQMSDA